MKQKLALSCALIHRPEVLFLDEPTTGVDAVSRREFWDLLTDLKKSGLTILVATPYMDEAARCDRVALMQEGRILAIDAPRDIGDRFTAPLFSVHGSDRYRMLQVLREYPNLKSVSPFGSELHYADSRTDAAAGDIQRFLQSRGFDDAVVTRIEPGIEDTFMALIGESREAAA